MKHLVRGEHRFKSENETRTDGSTSVEDVDSVRKKKNAKARKGRGRGTRPTGNTAEKWVHGPAKKIWATRSAEPQTGPQKQRKKKRGSGSARKWKIRKRQRTLELKKTIKA